MKWPLAWLHPPHGDVYLRFVVRALGLASIALFGVGVLGAVAAVQALAMADNGWNDLIAVLAAVLGAAALVAGFTFSWIAHRASTTWALEGVEMRRAGWALVLVGATAWAPIAWLDDVTSLDRFLALARVALMGLGVMLLTRISRSQSHQA